MHQPLNDIVHFYFKREHLRDVPGDELFFLIKKFPYSPLFHFLYTRKLKENGDSRFPQAVSRTAFYFSNPHWLNHQMQERYEKDMVRKLEGALEAAAFQAELLEAEPEPDFLHENGTMNGMEPEMDPISARYHEETEELVPETISSPEPASETLQSNEDLSEERIEIADQAEASPNITIQPEPEPIVEEFNPGQDFNESGNGMYTTHPQVDQADFHSANGPSTEASAFADTDTNIPTDIHETPGTTTEASSEVIDAQVNADEVPAAERQLEEVSATDVGTQDMTTTSGLDSEAVTEHKTWEPENQPEDWKAPQEAEAEQNPEQAESTDEVQTTPDEGQAPLVLHLPDLNAPPASDIISFEPLHAVDYFASQGIKLSREEEDKSQLGGKTKRFTEWLRAMKKIHPEKLKNQMDEQEESTVVKGAELSNQQGPVLTETMALVLLQQGKKQQAIEILMKLSLLDPSKSAYFAAKIDEFKRTV